MVKDKELENYIKLEEITSCKECDTKFMVWQNNIPVRDGVFCPQCGKYAYEEINHWNSTDRNYYNVSIPKIPETDLSAIEGF